MSDSLERRRRIDDLLGRALDLPPEERPAFLERECGPDRALREQVEKLLQLGEATGDFLRAGGGAEGPLVEEMASRSAVAPSLSGGSRVGPFEVIRELGRGGMAVVYLAARADGHFEQQVALKVIQGGLGSQMLVERFRQERQILASLSHPNIARLLDGGVLEDGHPYLAMEYVDGRPLDAYCDDRGLSIRDRLRLVQTVARAVQYAHRNLVVHRDIKPSNILATADGDVKLLDFGIAKVLDTAADPSPRTATHLQMMTPQYASPEQVLRAPLSTASDIYQLGLLAYVLLAGRLPYDLSQLSPTAAERAVCETAPPRPSSLALTEDAAAARGTTPAGLRRALEGDLDAIILTALRKEPERRYASAERLAEDIGCYLRGEPVAARGDDLAYRARRFLRRHRVAVGVAGAFGLMLTGYAATVTVQSRALARERDRAREQQQAAEQVTDFLVDVFEVSDPSVSGGTEPTALQVLQQGADRVCDAISDRPEIRARLESAIGRIYWKLGHYPESRTMLEEALKLRREAGPDAGPELAESLEDLSRLLRDLEERETAEAMQREALAIREEQLGTHHPDTIGSMTHLGMLLLEEGRHDEAEPWLRRALALNRELYGDHHEEVATSLNNLGRVLRYKGEYPAAEEALRQALEMRREILGERHNETLSTLSNLALVLRVQGQYREAVEMFREVADAKRVILGDKHPYFAIHLSNLAAAMQLDGQLAESIPVLEEALAIRREIMEPDHPEIAANLNDMARGYHDMGDLAAARPLYEEALRIYRIHGDHPWMPATLYNLAELLEAEGDPAGALPLAEESLRLDREGLGEDHPAVGRAHVLVARIAHGLGDLERSEQGYQRGLEILRAKLPPKHPDLSQALLEYGRLLSDAGRNEAARQVLQESLDIHTELYGPSDARTADARAALAAASPPSTR